MGWIAITGILIPSSLASSETPPTLNPWKSFSLLQASLTLIPTTLPGLPSLLGHSKPRQILQQYQPVLHDPLKNPILRLEHGNIY